MYEQFYKLSYGDVMIAGANVEVSNRLTLIRRPGNPEFSGNTYTDIQAFGEFRVNKAQSDAFGTTLEEIFTMISTPGALYAELDGVKQLVFADSAALGQTYMQSVGNELYFSNGIDNKKWLQSLITWAANFELQGADGLSGTYPFMSTYLLTGATSPTSNTQQIQQFIGIAIANITEVQTAAGILTLTVNNAGLSNPGAKTPTYDIGSVFQLWGLTTATWLNGATIEITAPYTVGTSTTIVAKFAVPTADTVYGPAADTGYVQQVGTIPIIGITGATTPTWGTVPPSSSNNFMGSVTLDGNLLWVNRGPTVENWGIQAPTTAPTTSESGTSTVGWKAGTYYSAPGVIIDGSMNIWQITTAGTTGGTNPFPATPTVGQTQIDGTVLWTCVSTSVAGGNAWAPHASFSSGAYEGAYPWTAVTTPADGSFLPDWKSGHFIIANAAGTPCLFTLQKYLPNSNVNVPISVTYGGGTSSTLGWTCQFFNHSHVTPNTFGCVDIDWGGSVGNPVMYGTSTPATPTASATGVSGIMWNYYKNGAGGHGYDTHPMKNNTINSAGETADGTFTTPWSGMPSDVYEFLQYGKIRIPVAGMNVTFTIPVNDAAWFGIESTAGAVFSSFSATGATGGLTNLGQMGTRTLTPWNGYPILAGWNGGNNGDVMTIVINFPNAGVFGIEFAFGKNSSGGSNTHNFFYVGANGYLMVPEQAIADPFFETSTNPPSFGSAGWNLIQASQNTYPNTPEIQSNAVAGDFPSIQWQSGQLQWYNLGPATDFAWKANTPVTLASTIIIDKNSNEERSYEAGVSGTTQPVWNTSLYSITADQAPLQWINEGSIPPVNNTPGTITATSAQGWIYWVALVNTLDNTVSNLGPASVGTGPVIAGQITLPPGSGLNSSTIDPQADYVAIFRTTDGGATPILVPGLGNSFWTVPLTQYLQNGYVDSTADVDLDTEIEGPEAGENTPPLPGTVNLTYHLGRIFYSIGNSVFYTSGPTSPAGNGNGTNPENFDVLPSRVVRLVPTAIGMLVFTVSDIYIIAGNGTSTNPILPAVPYLTGVGLANYNALDINGSLIGFFTTDKQFLIFDPSAGLSYVGNPIGDQLRLNNGKPGQSWNTSTAYVAWYTNGEDQAWFLGDGQFGWYKLIATPSPETGNCWSPFATIASGGVSAIQAIETSPGFHSLLIGPSGTGNILARDLDATTDGGASVSNGSTYLAYGVFGSYILALPGQIAKVSFITTVSVKVGSPLIIGLLIDEALPYYKGSFDILKNWTTDPPNVPPSKSFYKQRFYLSEDKEESAYCSDLQLLVQWPAEAAQNELQSFSLWGAYEVEQ